MAEMNTSFDKDGDVIMDDDAGAASSTPTSSAEQPKRTSLALVPSPESAEHQSPVPENCVVARHSAPTITPLRLGGASPTHTSPERGRSVSLVQGVTSSSNSSALVPFASNQTVPSSPQCDGQPPSPFHRPHTLNQSDLDAMARHVDASIQAARSAQEHAQAAAQSLYGGSWAPTTPMPSLFQSPSASRPVPSASPLAFASPAPSAVSDSTLNTSPAFVSGFSTASRASTSSRSLLTGNLGSGRWSAALGISGSIGSSPSDVGGTSAPNHDVDDQRPGPIARLMMTRNATSTSSRNHSPHDHRVAPTFRFNTHESGVPDLSRIRPPPPPTTFGNPATRVPSVFGSNTPPNHGNPTSNRDSDHQRPGPITRLMMARESDSRRRPLPPFPMARSSTSTLNPATSASSTFDSSATRVPSAFGANTPRSRRCGDRSAPRPVPSPRTLRLIADAADLCPRLSVSEIRSILGFPAAEPELPADDTSDDTWACSACTYENSSSISACMICDTPRRSVRFPEFCHECVFCVVFFPRSRHRMVLRC